MAARAALREHLPELVPTWERLCRLAGGGDTASRVLAHWCPPPHLAGCTQAVVRRGAPILVRNYDYDVRSFDATILSTDYAGRRVLGTGDCIWGLLDGLNEDGLAATLTFGGSREVGTGFGISIVMRYLLETCTTVAEALAVLDRVPVHMAYNVTVLDAAGASATAFIGPGHPPLHVDRPVVTNHQEDRATEQYAKLSHSRDREVAVRAVLEAPGDEERAIRAFLEPPTYNRALRPLLRHPLHGGDAAGGGLHRLPLAGRPVAPVVRRLRSGRAHGRAPHVKRYQARRARPEAHRAETRTDCAMSPDPRAFGAETFWGQTPEQARIGVRPRAWKRHEIARECDGSVRA